MIKWFKKAFQTKQHLEVTTSPWEDTTFKILHELKYNRSPLSLIVPGEKQMFATFILDIDAKKQTIVLDELFPQEGNELAKPGSTITIKGRHQGVHINFECGVEKAFNRHGLKGLMIQFPEGLDYMQRRDAFRVTPPDSHPLMCQFSIDSTQRIEATIQDISLTGMKLLVPNNIVSMLKPRMTLEQSSILQPNHDAIVTNLKLCHITYDAQLQATILGCEFQCSRADVQRDINHLVTDLQRLINYQAVDDQESSRNIS